MRIFFFTERDKLQFDIRPIDKSSWKYFSKYHYLSENLPGGSIYLYGLFHGDKQIGFQCFANYTPHRDGTNRIYHSNRTVVHPDYQGLGLGIKLINESTKVFVQAHPEYRVMAKFSAVPVFKAMIKQKEWKFLGEERLFGMMKKGGSMERQTGFREGGIKTYQFEFKHTPTPVKKKSTKFKSFND
jgi:GNAT superfamily N-acetyltransferase